MFWVFVNKDCVLMLLGVSLTNITFKCTLGFQLTKACFNVFWGFSNKDRILICFEVALKKAAF